MDEEQELKTLKNRLIELNKLIQTELDRISEMKEIFVKSYLRKDREKYRAELTAISANLKQYESEQAGIKRRLAAIHG